MICLYAAEESLFEHNGLGILDNDLKKCHVEELINNLYTLTAQYPLWAKFGKLIRNGMIIKAPTPNGDQLFRIYQSKPSMGMLEIHAFHIFYDLAFNFVEDTNIVSKSGQAWLQQLSQNTQYSHPFTFFSDISKVAGSRVVRKNCVEILLNTSLDNSFVNRFGGEILRDNFKVYFNRAIGENRGFKIRHKKNLKGYTANIDDKSVITRIMPIGFDGLLLPEKYVDSPRIRDYPFPRIGKVEVDVKAAVGENADAKDAVPLNEAYTKMRTLIKEQFGVIDVPTCSYEVDFVELSKTKEYADFQNLETVRIGDTVTVSHDEDGFYVEAKVIRYEYDSLAGSLLRIEAGQFESRSSNNSINQQRSIEQQLEDVKIETSNMVQVAANGKNTIYRGIDRPANANVGDLWYEPLENSVVLKQWSGVDWELIPISDQNLGNVNVNNLSGNHIDVRRFRISSGDRDILYVNEVGEVILNAKRVQIDFTDVATKDDLKKIELTPGPKGEKGEPGQRGEDGRTPYIHRAYSDNADGTGLTTSDNGQRYIGHYSDYTQADSTDKTKYKWADRWAKIEVGGRNILRNATFSNPKERSETFTVGGTTYKNIEIPNWSSMYNSGIPNPTISYHAFYRESFNGTGPVIEFNESNGQRNWKALNQTLQASDLRVGKYTFSADIFATGVGTKIQFGIYYYNKAGQRDFHSGKTTINISTINKWHRVSGNLKLNDDIDFTKEIRFYIYAFEFTTNSILYLTKPQLEEGTVATTFGEAQADVDKRIDAKADQALTQEQLNALNEKNGLMQAELEAKASLATVTQWFDAYQNFVKANEADKAQAEQDLVVATQRILAVENNLSNMSERWNFIDTYMSVQNEGLVVGKNDGSSSAIFSDDRISFISAGKEVAYFSAGALQVDNGVFTTTIQIGRFREEQYHNNPDINVKRYVGG
ncbi:TPA: phage tail protein [Streptococcus suis]|uniref:phage tail spike protein n=1 Tax=Streptococcus suis TaxID=1307 RepID=UPI0009431848|nr:phage tail spike protein [Streptococcus suis]HEL1931419.1 phage tail protein [Streptococcus suis]HEL1932948.1 phage tail protein [Streptococcus suis]HEM5332074.1 phage tail protein [Streptococcus suis]